MRDKGVTASEVSTGKKRQTPAKGDRAADRRMADAERSRSPIKALKASVKKAAAKKATSKPKGPRSSRSRR